MNKQPKPKKCRECGELFTTQRPLQIACGYACALAYSIKKSNQKALKEHRFKSKELKEKLLTHKDWLGNLQKVFNKFIRERDKDLPCITCGTIAKVEYAAGHFYPTTYQFLRFNEDNVNKQ